MEIFSFILLVLFVWLLINYFTSSSSKIKGEIGERRVAKKLSRLNKLEYIVLNDVLLNHNGFTTQIDHIVICQSGIIVIETKNYAGWIHGHEKAQYWTQTIYKRKSKLLNPIKQNWNHIFALKKILKQQRIRYYPIVVFSGDATLKNITADLPVIYTKSLLRTIHEINQDDYLTKNQMISISEKLLSFNTNGKKEKKAHAKSVKQRIQHTESKIKMKICPKCGNDLVLRKGKFGRFYGCSNYPKCKYTVN